MVRLTIDGDEIEVKQGRSLLEACRENGIYVPTLCYHPALEPYGGCRLCMVTVSQGGRPPRLVASCTHPCEDGVQVQTNSEMVKRSRRLTIELLLSSAYSTPEIRGLAAELGVSEPRYYLPEPSDCILCGLCVRACREIAGVSAIGVIRRGIAKRISAPFQVASSRCIGCGTCSLICPTGAFKLSEVSGTKPVLAGENSYRRWYFRSGAELDLRPAFIQDVASLLVDPEDSQSREE
jgi:bidirectional [NiFe] hydrogenase diaphorase subunit